MRGRRSRSLSAMSESVSTNRPSSWWRHAIVYQVYPRSFRDANGDGTGDVEGIRLQLPYLSALGVDAIWMNPWYPSPLLDGGYDVADYRDIAPRFGTLDDARRLIAEAHDHNIKVIVDLVPNHTSWEHEWFKAALAGGPGSPERERYIFRPGSGPNGSLPPNNWVSVFGGSAWTQTEDGEWYLHLFDISQPDLNWNHPAVREEFRSIFRFWTDLGADGFRVDVAHGLIKDQTFRDVDDPDKALTVSIGDDHPHWDRDEVHEINREWRAVLNEQEARLGRELMMVAEAGVSPESLPLYLRPDEYHQAFNFDFLECPWDRDEMVDRISDAIARADAVGSASTWVLSNHDRVRHATRYGLPVDTDNNEWLMHGPYEILDADLGLRRARAATLLLLALPGSTYVYQGEELGLHEVYDLPHDVLDDPVWARSEHTFKGRDGCRVPMPWTADGPSFGFGSAGSWLPQPASFATVAASAQDGVTGSTLELYRAAIALRRELWVNAPDLVWDNEERNNVLSFTRGSLRCVINLGDDAIDLPNGDLVLSSDDVIGNMLPGNTGCWLRV